MALTDNLNFGNPERPEIMGQLVGCIQGIAAACKALDFPVVSGNVSLYNETNGRAILPTPTIGGVGLLDDFAKSASIGFKAADELIVLLGETKGWTRPVALPARDLRARGGRAAAGRPDGGAARRRFRARPDRGAARDRGARHCPTAACWSRSPRWRWRPASARNSTARPLS